MVIYMTYRYGWTTRTVGFMMAAVGLTNGIAQGALVGPIIKKFGEQKTLLLGLIFGVMGFLIAAFSSVDTWFWFSVPFLALWGLTNAVIQGMMTQEVGADQQGYLQGAIGSLRGIAELIGPGLFSFIFAYFIKPESFVYLPGAPFLLAAFFMLIAILVLLRRTFRSN
jgi:MFS transporter, DHA1 family, tetracycline resistance protein